MEHSFNLPSKNRTVEGWSVVGLVLLMLGLLWLSL